MHYIRFLKPPRLTDNSLRGGPSSLTAKITTTTDLGESFLCLNTTLIAELVASDGHTVLGRDKEVEWKGETGMRDLEVVLQIPGRQKDNVRMLVRPKSTTHSVVQIDKLLSGEGEGGIVAVRSMPISLTPAGLSPASNTIPLSLAERVFTTMNPQNPPLHIWEETGESIARHIWDAGLLLSAYISTISSTPTSKLPLLESLLKNGKGLSVLELGSGCGIVSLTLALLFPAINNITLTDLPEATEILTHNLSHHSMVSCPVSMSHQVLDWSEPLPQNVVKTKWDMVAIADCTYNPDVVPDLVNTLKSVSEGHKTVMVLLAMKVRHESEMVFFELMEKGGFMVWEKFKIPLPVLGGEHEEIEIFVFGLGEMEGNESS